jgi:hypothetical protein
LLRMANWVWRRTLWVFLLSLAALAASLRTTAARYGGTSTDTLGKAASFKINEKFCRRETRD